MCNSAGIAPAVGVSYGVLLLPPRNEMRLDGLIPVIFRRQECTRLVISEYASLVRKSY